MKIALINQKTKYYDYFINRDSYLNKIKNASEEADIIIGPELSISNISRPIDYYEFMSFCDKVSEYVDNNKLIIPGTGIVFSNEKKIMSNIAPIITKEELFFIYKKHFIEIEEKAAKRAGLKFNTGKDNEGFFNYNGLNIGLVICNDHSKGRLKNLTKKNNINLELLIACGLNNVTQNDMVVENGLFCYNDGFEIEGKTRIYARKIENNSFYPIESIDKGDYVLIEHDLTV